VKHALRTKSVGTKVSEAELRVLESRAEAAGRTLSEWVRDVLLDSSVEDAKLAYRRTALDRWCMNTKLLRMLARDGFKEGNDGEGRRWRTKRRS
jgi:hypothetical protein